MKSRDEKDQFWNGLTLGFAMGSAFVAVTLLVIYLIMTP
jgi:hypothetical protein